MGNYNPHAPRILGQEWVPIRDENLVFQPKVNAFEVGHKFTLTSTKQVRDARFYTNGVPPGYIASQTIQANVYQFGTEDQTGPISQVFIPCNAGTVTGANTTLVGSTTLAEALLSPTDAKYLECAYNSGSPQDFSMFFAVNSYPQLANKRILNVSLAYAGNITDQDAAGNQVSFFDPDPLIPTTVVRAQTDSGSQTITYSKFWAPNTGSLDAINSTVLPGQSGSVEGQTVTYLNLGDVNSLWGTQSGAQREVLPWRYVDLQKFEASSGVLRQFIWVRVQIPVTPNGVFVRFRMDYAALRVIYCEEKRVLYGGYRPAAYVLGTNTITLRDLSQNADPILPPGEYLTTFGAVNPGDINFGGGTNTTFPNFNSVRQYYEIPPHPSVEITVPFPVEDNLGATFTSARVQTVPQLTLHSSGGPLTEVHVYGRQVAAQVFGANTATQEIYDDIVGVNTVYNQVRFYARRFGDTTTSLSLTGVGGLSGSSVSITPTDFDALDEIIDGWKQVTLTFSSPPTMGTLVAPSPQWTWSAVGETSGNRWEILGACAPALSGIPGNLYNLMPTIQQLYEGTYQPPGGSIAELNWMPQGVGSPPVTGATDDDSTDAVLIFAMNPPTVTGFTVISQSQALTGIGQDCGINPCGIPSAMLYHKISWSATSSGIIPASGFGFYELQRSDTITDWATIMKYASPTGASFNDFEARVGIATSYRIRAVDVLGFEGPWSSTVSITMPAPGASGGCLNNTLLFSSNEHQNGAVNLAYSEAWEGQVEEGFTFPEAGFVQLQAMYNRDFFTAFRPLERGGEQFDRNVLVQAAAISPPTLADFRSLRDMAWDNVSYICVRDDDGNRWFATVLVPNGSVRHFRKLYMAPIRVIEVTATPSPVPLP